MPLNLEPPTSVLMPAGGKAYRSLISSGAVSGSNAHTQNNSTGTIVVVTFLQGALKTASCAISLLWVLGYGTASPMVAFKHFHLRLEPLEVMV